LRKVASLVLKTYKIVHIKCGGESFSEKFVVLNVLMSVFGF